MLFFKKLLRLEEIGRDAGLPLGGGLTGWRKIVVGDRTLRIVFKMNADETVATVWVIGDRDDAACYEEARRRVDALDVAKPQAISLAAAMFEIGEHRRASKRRDRRR
jgi:mRNA interferase RelE/StbE